LPNRLRQGAVWGATKIAGDQLQKLELRRGLKNADSMHRWKELAPVFPYPAQKGRHRPAEGTRLQAPDFVSKALFARDRLYRCGLEGCRYRAIFRGIEELRGLGIELPPPLRFQPRSEKLIDPLARRNATLCPLNGVKQLLVQGKRFGDPFRCQHITYIVSKYSMYYVNSEVE
jgi:hypothetical protein